MLLDCKHLEHQLRNTDPAAVHTELTHIAVSAAAVANSIVLAPNRRPLGRLAQTQLLRGLVELYRRLNELEREAA